MTLMTLHDLHSRQGAAFGEVNGAQCVLDHGDAAAEYEFLRGSAGVLDLSLRGRLCVTGPDRVEFLHGQVTNNVKALAEGEGCYAALVDHKGRIQSDLNVYRLKDELLLDFEPGMSAQVMERLEKYIIAEDVEVIDAAPHYGLLSVQGPRSAEVISAMDLSGKAPDGDRRFLSLNHATFGEIYLAHRRRIGEAGFDLFIPNEKLEQAHAALAAAAEAVGGGRVGWRALEIARVEAGAPRYGVDMDESNLAPETGIADEAISYSKGCYIGQEVIARIRTYGRVSKSLCGLRLADDLKLLPVKGDLLFCGEKKVGHITSAVQTPRSKANLALGYVRRESNEAGSELTLRSEGGGSVAIVAEQLSRLSPPV